MDTVLVRFRGSKGDQGRKGSVLVKMRGDGHKGAETVEFLQELYRMHDGRSDLRLMAYQG